MSIGLPLGVTRLITYCLFFLLGSQSLFAQPIWWKPYFTLFPEEGTRFVVDTNAIVPGGGVPALNITKAGDILLSSAGGPQLNFFRVLDNGRSYQPLSGSLPRGPDGGFIYLSDGRIRFVTEEAAPDRTPQRHKSRVISWISNDGVSWTKESGIRYQPGIEDDSISSVVSTIQVNNAMWRMYFVGDFYRTNGTRTAISNDWGLTWQKESVHNVLKRGDVDPHPVYLTNGKIRLYFRTGFHSPGQSNSGIAYCDSEDGVRFDTIQTRLIIPDTIAPRLLKLDPAVIRFPNGSVACYIGASPAPGNPPQGSPALIVAWDSRPVGIHEEYFPPFQPDEFSLFQNYPNPFNAHTTICFNIPANEYVVLKIFDLYGREVASLLQNQRGAGQHSVTFDASALGSGVYLCRLRVGSFVQTRKIVLIR